MSDLAPPPVGHNSPPAYDPAVIEAFKPRINAFAETAGAWLDMGEIESDEDAARINDFLAGARKLAKEIDAARVEAKRPHDDRAKEVQTAFASLVAVLEKVADRPKPLLTRFLQRKKEAEERERQRQREEAARKQREADERLRLAQMQNDVVGEAEAEAMAKAAAKEQKAASKPVTVSAGSATGGAKAVGLRTIRDVRLVSISQAFVAFREAPEVAELLTTLARRRVQAGNYDGTPIPGFERADRQVV